MFCVQYVEIYTEQRAFADAINFCFHLKKTAAESYRLLRDAYGEHVPSEDTCERWLRRFKSGDFDTRQEGRQGTRKTSKKIRRCGIALLNEDDSQTQKQLAEHLCVSQQAVFNQLREMGKFQKTGR